MLIGLPNGVFNQHLNGLNARALWEIRDTREIDGVIKKKKKRYKKRLKNQT